MNGFCLWTSFPSRQKQQFYWPWQSVVNPILCKRHELILKNTVTCNYSSVWTIMEINLKKPKYSGHKVSSYFIQDVCICNNVVPTASSSLRQHWSHHHHNTASLTHWCSKLLHCWWYWLPKTNTCTVIRFYIVILYIIVYFLRRWWL